MVLPQVRRSLLELSKSLPTGELGSWRERKGKISGLERSLGLQGAVGSASKFALETPHQLQSEREGEVCPAAPGNSSFLSGLRMSPWFDHLKNIMQVRKTVISFCYSLQQGD